MPKDLGVLRGDGVGEQIKIFSAVREQPWRGGAIVQRVGDVVGAVRVHGTVRAAAGGCRCQFHSGSGQRGLEQQVHGNKLMRKLLWQPS